MVTTVFIVVMNSIARYGTVRGGVCIATVGREVSNVHFDGCPDSRLDTHSEDPMTLEGGRHEARDETDTRQRHAVRGVCIGTSSPTLYRIEP